MSRTLEPPVLQIVFSGIGVDNGSCNYKTGNRPGCRHADGGLTMRHITSIGLDVHARSITGSAFNPITGEVITKRFMYDASDVANWVSGFESPKAVYESGVTGFDLARKLNLLGVDCVVCASSKLQRPPADARRKNDENDSVFLARLLATNNIVEVFIPDEETEAAHNLVRAHQNIRQDLTRARQRLGMFLIRHGYVWNEKKTDGSPKSSWTSSHWVWIRNIEFENEADMDTLALYISEVRHLEQHKKQLENFIRREAAKDRWRIRVDALRCLKGIEVVTAFALVVEVCVFSRFKSASAYASWLGLTPSEHSSGEHIFKGSITKCGNSLCRRLIIEASWHYARASDKRKKAPTPEVSLSIENRAAKAIKRLVKQRRHLIAKGKRSVVANVATARELACFVWAIGCEVEGSLQK